MASKDKKERRPLFTSKAHDHVALNALIDEASKYVGALVLAAYRGASSGIGVDADRLEKADEYVLIRKAATCGFTEEAIFNPDELRKAGLLDDMKARIYDLRGIIGRKLAELPKTIKWNVRKGMKPDAWESAGRMLKRQLDKYLKPLAEELAVKGIMLGTASAHRDERNRRADDDSYEFLEKEMFGGYVPDTLRSATERYDLGPAGLKELEHAHSRLAAEITSIPEDVRDAVRDQVLRAEREGKSPRELASDLYHIKDDMPELSGKTAEHRMRDWHRVAQYELASAWSAGKAAATEDLAARKPVYLVFGGSGQCDRCAAWQGTIVRQVPRSQVKNERDDSLSAMGIKDGVTNIAWWTGKNNIGLKKKDWRICWPAHNWCGDTGTKIDPELQEYDEKEGVVRFKKESSADKYIPDDFLKELEDERAKKRERLDRQEADRASGVHKRDARYYENWRK